MNIVALVSLSAAKIFACGETVTEMAVQGSTRMKITLSIDDLVINIVWLGLTPTSVLDVNRVS